MEYRDISPEEVNQRIDSEEDVILLDVRTPEECADEHIPGSLLIPVDDIKSEAEIKLTDTKKPIFVYCRSGRRGVILRYYI